MKAGEETSSEAQRKAGIEWLNNQLDILTLKKLYLPIELNQIINATQT